jgi:hypothetical protein
MPGGVMLIGSWMFLFFSLAYFFMPNFHLAKSSNPFMLTVSPDFFSISWISTIAGATTSSKTTSSCSLSAAAFRERNQQMKEIQQEM